MARVVIVGGGGHASALADFVGDADQITDDTLVRPDDIVIIGVGDVATRKRLFEKFEGQVGGIGGFDAYTTRMRGAIVYGSVVLGKNVLINTGAQIDHDCIIGDHCVIGPGAILCGNVTLGPCCAIGAGAIILQGVELDEGTMVPAGTLVVGPDDFRKPQRVVRDV